MADNVSYQPLIAVRKLLVKRNRVVAHVQVDPARAYSTPAFARALVSQRPDLPRHACVNSHGDYFGDVIGTTSLPHVLEHLVIDFQCEACADERPDWVFTGVTRWLDKEQGSAVVEVSYRDDLIALRAFRDAAALMNGLR